MSGDTKPQRKRIRDDDIQIPPEAEEVLFLLSTCGAEVEEAAQAIEDFRLDVLAGLCAPYEGKRLPREERDAIEVGLAAQANTLFETVHRKKLVRLAAELVAAVRNRARALKKLDGIDLGESLEHLPEINLSYDGERAITVTVNGVERKTFMLPIPLDRGVYRSGHTYERGDTVSHGGSLWIAQRTTTLPPSTPDAGWRLAIKKGKDAR